MYGISSHVVRHAPISLFQERSMNMKCWFMVFDIKQISGDTLSLGGGKRSVENHLVVKCNVPPFHERWARQDKRYSTE